VLIPDPLWFLVRAIALAGCLMWFHRSRSPHLRTAAVGIGILVALMLPSLYHAIFGWEQFDELAGRYIDPEILGPYATGRSPGELLIDRCKLAEWIGMAFFALGITRFSKLLAGPTPLPDEP
jgi:hypothetical protein